MSLFLLIETTADLCSAALSDNEKILIAKESVEPRSHAAVLTVLVDELMHESGNKMQELSAVVFSEGPGSYTGLRIGASVCKGICYGLGIPLIAVPTLKAMAAHAAKFQSDILLCPMLDARRMEVYCSLYNLQLETLEKTQAKIIDEGAFSDRLEKEKICFFGPGSDKCKPFIHHRNAQFIGDIVPKAEFMLNEAMKKYTEKDFVDTAYFEPFYLKEFMATTPKRKVL